MAYKVKGNMDVASKLTANLAEAKGFDTVTTSQLGVTATPFTIDLIGGERDFTVALSNASTGDVGINAPVNAPPNGNFIRINLSNTDTVSRNFVLDTAYKNADGVDYGTLSVAAGEGRVLELYYTDAAPTTWVVTVDTGLTASGGLVKRGTVTSDADNGEGIYNLDASAAAFDFTLPTAVGSQTRYMFIGENFSSNATTIKVQGGEALNTITDASFTANTVGQLLLATDQSTGNWALTVVGAGEVTTNPYARLELRRADIANLGVATINDVTVATAVSVAAVIPFTTQQSAVGGMITDLTGWVDNSVASQQIDGTNTAMGVTVPVDGDYEYVFSAPNVLDSTVQANDIPIPAIFVNGILIDILDFSEYTSTNNAPASGGAGRVSLTSGDMVQLGYVIQGGQAEAFNLIAGAATTTVGAYAGGPADVVHGFFEISKVRNNNVVMAGMVTPTPLTRGRVDLTSDHTPAASYATIPSMQVTLPAAGTYRVYGVVNYFLNSTAGNGGFYHSLYNEGTSFIESGTEYRHWGGSGASDNNGGTGSFEKIVTVLAPTTFSLQSYRATAAGTFTATVRSQASNGTTYIAYEELPVSTVVDPDLLTPVSLSNMELGLAATAAGTTCPLDTVLVTDGSGLSLAGNGVTVGIAGKYRIEAFAELLTVTQDIEIQVNGVAVQTYTEGSIQNRPKPVIMDLAASDVITLFTAVSASWLGGASSATTDTNFARLLVTQMPLATILQVDPDLITPTPLHSVSRSMTGTSFVGVDDPVIFDTTHDDTGGLVTDSSVVTIVQDGKYEITVDASYDFDQSIGNVRYMRLVKNLTNPADDVAAAAAQITDAYSYTDATTSGIKSNSLTVIVDLVAGDTLIAYFEAASGNDRVKTCHMIVKQLTTSTVIRPEDATVSTAVFYKMGNSAAQALGGNATTQLVYDTTILSQPSGAVFSANPASGIFTLSSGMDGIYQITANVDVDNSINSASYTVLIMVNGTEAAVAKTSSTNAQDGTAFNLSTGPVSLVQGDIISARYITNDGNGRTTQNGVTRNWLSVMQLSRNVVT